MKTGMNSFILMMAGAGIEFCRFVKSHRNAAHPPHRFQSQFPQSSRVRGGSSHASGFQPSLLPSGSTELGSALAMTCYSNAGSNPSGRLPDQSSQLFGFFGADLRSGSSNADRGQRLA
jgi:hypothetical protein